jgi:hypothetical protein
LKLFLDAFLEMSDPSDEKKTRINTNYTATVLASIQEHHEVLLAKSLLELRRLAFASHHRKSTDAFETILEEWKQKHFPITTWLNTPFKYLEQNDCFHPQPMLMHIVDAWHKPLRPNTHLEKLQMQYVYLLLEARSQIMGRDSNGKTALHVARTSAVARLLLVHNAEVNAVCHGGATPLMNACAGDGRDRRYLHVLVGALLAHKADATMIDQNGHNAAYYCRVTSVYDLVASDWRPRWAAEIQCFLPKDPTGIVLLYAEDGDRAQLIELFFEPDVE